MKTAAVMLQCVYIKPCCVCTELRFEKGTPCTIEESKSQGFESMDVLIS